MGVVIQLPIRRRPQRRVPLQTKRDLSFALAEALRRVERLQEQIENERATTDIHAEWHPEGWTSDDAQRVLWRAGVIVAGESTAAGIGRLLQRCEEIDQ